MSQPGVRARPRSVAVLALALALVALASTAGATAPRARAADPRILLGVFPGRAIGSGADPTSLAAMTAWQGKPNAVATVFASWDTMGVPAVDSLFTTVLPQLWAAGSVPSVSWMPVVGAGGNADIARGRYDGYIDAWTAAMKAWLAGPDRAYGNSDDRRAYLRLAHEMNGGWYSYSGCFEPDAFVQMWRHVHDRITGAGIDSTRLAWMWAPMVSKRSCGDALTMYPGDAYVDWVGLDGFDDPPAALFGPDIARFQSAMPSKPIAVAETAKGTPGYISADPTKAWKSNWITAYFQWVATTPVKMTVWFNGHDLRLNAGDPEFLSPPWDGMVFGGLSGDQVWWSGAVPRWTYRAYRDAVASSTFVGSDRGNPRLLTDDQFLGR